MRFCIIIIKHFINKSLLKFSKMKKFTILFVLLVLNFCRLSAQTFCLGYQIISKTSTDLVIQVNMQGSSSFKLGTSTLSMTFNYAALSLIEASTLDNDLEPNPTSVIVTPSPYDVINVFDETVGGGGGSARIAINLTNPNTGTTIAAAPAWSNLVRMRFNILNGTQTTMFAYNPSASGLSTTKDNGVAISVGSGCPTLNVVINSIALPVNLIYFTGKNVNKTNVLKWATANERNNYGFDVERSTDGQNFSSIGFVRGAGSSSSTQNYTFEDSQVEKGTTYYRLKQIDTDNRFEYSTIIALQANGKTKVKIYPTLVHDNLIVEGAVSFDIVNNLGQVVLQNTSGDNTVSLQQLQNGIYFVRATDENGESFIQKIVKE